MKIEKMPLDDLYVIVPQVYNDNRGWFYESYNRQSFMDNGINIEFIQDNHSLSISKYTMRGIHFQNNPYAQSKLVRCIVGRILDIAVDLRRGSPTYCKWIAVELSAENKKQLFIPKGFGHAFITLEENTQVCYKVDAPWSKEHERTISYLDPDINIKWPEGEKVLSDKDANAPFLNDCDINFIYGEW